jgi:hypothetical protein
MPCSDVVLIKTDALFFLNNFQINGVTTKSDETPKPDESKTPESVVRFVARKHKKKKTVPLIFGK